jgi:predicted RNA-binding protein associated with RNAse of E/G family
MAEICSGEFGDAKQVQDYRSEYLGEMLVERVIWGPDALGERNGTHLVGPGFVSFRFWLPRYEQVVERYYAPDGTLLGTQIDLCMPLIVEDGRCCTRDLILDLWIAPDGRVVLHGEAAFEAAVRQNQLNPDEARYAEQHLRRLTAAIAQTRFPPPFVRNWQVDQRRIQEVQPATTESEAAAAGQGS